MKVRMHPRPTGLSGKMGDLVYCYYKREGLVIARHYVYPTLTEHNGKIGSVNENLHKLAPSDGFKRDARSYVWHYNSTKEGGLKPLRTWTNLFVRLMYAMAKANPALDLRTLTREQIYEQNLPCITIKRAVEAGLLPKVYEWETLDKEM